MIGIIVHHRARPEAESAGLELIQTAGRAMKSFPGFRRRYVMVSHTEKNQISTVTIWDSREDYIRWVESDVNRGIVPPPNVWTSRPEPTFFDVLPE